MDVKRFLFVERLKNSGIVKVKENLKIGLYNPLEKPIVETWLEEQERLRQESFKKDEIKIAQEANRIAKSAKNAAWWSLGIAAFSILLSIFSIVKSTSR